MVLFHCNFITNLSDESANDMYFQYQVESGHNQAKVTLRTICLLVYIYIKYYDTISSLFFIGVFFRATYKCQKVYHFLKHTVSV